MQALMTSQGRTDDLIRKAQTGDRDAFGELFESFRERPLERISARSGRRVKQELDPEDVLQETFLRAFETVRLLARIPFSAGFPPSLNTSMRAAAAGSSGGEA
jgi:hypothetical protein